MVKYNYWFFNWIYVLECLYFMERIMKDLVMFFVSANFEIVNKDK